MTKKIITLSIKDLRELGIIPDKKKKKKRRTKKRSLKKDKYGNYYEVGGAKSDSSQMQPVTTYTPFTNTANVASQIQLAN